jgi:tRNA nucleotidyltransferase (CCA-adding enzyme)
MTLLSPAGSNLSVQLKQALSPEQDRLLHLVAEKAVRQLVPLYIVGGFVRDLLLGQHAADLDLVVEGDAVAFARSLAGNYGGKVISHRRFGTAIWYPDRDTVALLNVPTNEPFDWLTLDIISSRSETYSHPGALPKIQPGKLLDDLARRDFTINTLALRLDGKHFGEVHNVMGGLEDLRDGLIRVLHRNSFSDDPTRIFRAVRYEQRYGFRIAAETLALIPEALPVVAQISAERIRRELDAILEEENAASMMKRLAELHLFTAVHPALNWNDFTHARFMDGMTAAKTMKHPPSHLALGWTFWLMDVPVPVLKSVEKRLHFKSGLRKIILEASVLLTKVESLVGKKPSQCVLLLDKFPVKAIQVVFLALPDGVARQVLNDYLETWRHVKPKTTGHHLKKLGLQPGPVYQTILMRLRNAWLDGVIKSETEEDVLLVKLIKSRSS